jgi:hypothetical protein
MNAPPANPTIIIAASMPGSGANVVPEPSVPMPSGTTTNPPMTVAPATPPTTNFEILLATFAVIPPGRTLPATVMILASTASTIPSMALTMPAVIAGIPMAPSEARVNPTKTMSIMNAFLACFLASSASLANSRFASTKPSILSATARTTPATYSVAFRPAVWVSPVNVTWPH